MAYPYGYGFFDFNSVIQQWNSIGLFDIILPIVLVFTLVFAILQRTKVLGARREIDAVVALVIGFFAVSNPQVTGFLLPLFQNFAVGISIVLVGLLFMGLVLPRQTPFKWSGVMLLFAAVIFFWVMSRASRLYFSDYIIFSGDWWLLNSWWIIPTALFGIVIAFVMSGPPSLEGMSPEERTAVMKDWMDERNELRKFGHWYGPDSWRPPTP